MHIRLPELEPWRCPNLRSWHGPNSEHKFLRCTHALVEGDHVCHFNTPIIAKSLTKVWTAAEIKAEVEKWSTPQKVNGCRVRTQ